MIIHRKNCNYHYNYRFSCSMSNNCLCLFSSRVRASHFSCSLLVQLINLLAYFSLLYILFHDNVCFCMPKFILGIQFFLKQ